MLQHCPFFYFGCWSAGRSLWVSRFRAVRVAGRVV